jgi:diguanylate cyclase (GGDEF)-like protein
VIRLGKIGRQSFGIWVASVWMALLLYAVSTHAAEPVDLPSNLTMIDLGTSGMPVASQRANLAIEIPGDAPDSREVMELRSENAGPEFNWTIFTIRNNTPLERKLVLVVDEQRFASSGLLRLAAFGQNADGVVFSSGQDTLEREASHSGVAVTFVIKPTATVTIALEGTTGADTAKIYSPEAFAAREASLAFLRGAVMAITILLAFGMVALYAIRQNFAFLAGGFFALIALAFAALEGGYLMPALNRGITRGMPPDLLRGLTESMLVVALSLCITSFNGLWQRGVLVRSMVIFILAFTIGNVGYVFVDAKTATSTARLSFFVLSLLALVIGFSVRNSSQGVVRQGILLWSAMASWAIVSGVIASSQRPDLTQHTIILAGLSAVLALMTFTLVSFAFTQGFLAKPLLTDANRRSLAMAGAQHHVWDWQPHDGKLEVGQDLPRNLGYDPTAWNAAPAAAFRAALHPHDELGYQAMLNPDALQPGTFNELDLRLRDATGQYQWYVLRARALPGANKISSRCIGTLTKITNKQIADERVDPDAMLDAVTGLPSRAIFVDRLEREMSKPRSRPVRVVLVALERFKTLNDGLGHDFGDQLLHVAGRRISDCLLPDESAARISGSQFAVMFVETIDGRDITRLVEDLRAAIAAPVTMAERSVYLTAAIGVSHASSEGYTAAELQEQAASALHEAQSQGKAGTLYYDVGQIDDRVSRLDVESDLRRAISNQEIVVHYQPIVSLETREIAGMEALARWQHPTQGLIPPSKFMAIAEQAGLQTDIGKLVLAESVRQMGIWQRVHTRERPVFMSINMTADELVDATFVDRLHALIVREGVRPNTIKIEITESVAMRHPDRARQFVMRLQNLGVGVACDDFGTGFSSLASLRDLPFDTLKIDRSFLVPEAMEGRGGVIIDTVLSLAHGLGMLVVAEGIEGEAQASRLLAMGCDLGQGYFFSEPLPARDVEHLLSVLPRVQAPVVEPEFEDMALGTAPMAPRYHRAAEAIEVFDDETHDEYTEAADVFEPEELPSIFNVGRVPQPSRAAKVQKPKVKPKKKPAVKKPAAKKTKKKR